MAFSEEIKRKALVACGRTCCICHKFCGNNMEVHHIRARKDGGEDTFENAIPLCFNCHAEVRQYDVKHPKGIKFTEKELIAHRDNWYSKVKNEIRPNTEIKPIKIVRNKSLKELPKIVSGKEFVGILNNAQMLDCDYDEPNDQEEMELILEIISKMQECLDLLLESDISYQISIAFEFNTLIKKLDDKGFWIFAAIDVAKTKYDNLVDGTFNIAVVHIVRNTNNSIGGEHGIQRAD